MRKGQALVVVLLIMAVTATIGLSVATRTTSQVSVSTTQDESYRAMEAAEVGIERALGGLVATNEQNSVTNINASYYVRNDAISGKDKFRIPYDLASGDTVTVILNDSAGNNYNGNKLRVCWGKDGSTETPALEAMLYSDNGSIYTNREGYDDLGRYGFESSNVHSNCGSVQGYKYRLDIDLDVLGPTGTRKYLRVRMLGNTTLQPMLFDGQGVTLPPQAYDIQSTGQSGAATHKIQVINMFPDYQSMFDSAVWSGVGLSK